MFHNRHLCLEHTHPPKTLIRKFRIWGIFADGHEEVLVNESNNYQRLRRYSIEKEGLSAICLEPLETWGAEDFRLFACEAR